MVQNATKTAERSPRLITVGWLMLFVLYVGQVLLFTLIMTVHLNGFYMFWFLLFAPAFFRVYCGFYKKLDFAGNDDEIGGVWFTWALYIIAYVITIGIIFGKVAHELTKDDTFGINALLGTLCITPGLLLLLLQLTICPSYRKPVLSMSIIAALNIFDGIEMLEIFLMQNEADFDLNKETEICIVFFACFSFFLSPFGLARNKFMANGVVKERRKASMFLGPLEIIGTNLPFLVLRAVIWHKYEAAIFIAKNVVALVVGGVEFLILKGMCKCQRNSAVQDLYQI